MRLNLGCGSVTREGWVNVDAVKLAGVDVVHDLDVAPWPWEDGSVTRIEAKDIFEHVDRPVLFMTECHRVLRPGGVLHVRTPHYSCVDAFTDPTHKRQCTEQTFDFWIPGTVHYRVNNAGYGGVAFDRVDLHIDRQYGAIDVTLRKIV